MIAALAILALAQDPVTIPRGSKDPYTKNVPECERAAGLLDSDPQQAIDILDPILDNAKVEKRECRLRWENRPGDFSRYYDFYPYQFRGRARLKLAEKCKDSDKEKAKGLLEKAVSDLQASVDRGAASKDYLDAAKKMLAGLGASTGPAKAFEADWQKFIDKRDFAGAKKLVESDRSRDLTDAQRKAFLDDTTEKCRVSLDSASQRFLGNLKEIAAPRQLEIMSAGTFDRDFSLPERASLVEAAILPEYEWCVAVRPTLRSLREKKDALEPLLGHALKAVPLAVKGDYEWFGTLERLSYEIVRAGIASRADDARDAATEKRRQLRQEADGLQARWKTFDGDARKAAKDQDGFLRNLPSRDFSALFDRFPIDASAVTEIVASLQKTAESDDPEGALAEAAAKLEKFRDTWDRLARESKRDIVSAQIATGALRGFLDGDTLDRVASNLQELGRELKGLGGSSDEKRFGPKIQKLFAKIVK